MWADAIRQFVQGFLAGFGDIFKNLLGMAQNIPLEVHEYGTPKPADNPDNLDARIERMRGEVKP